MSGGRPCFIPWPGSVRSSRDEAQKVDGRGYFDEVKRGGRKVVISFFFLFQVLVVISGLLAV